MTIKIEFTTGDPDDALDAAGLIAFLVTRYPDAAEQAIERVTVTGTDVGAWTPPTNLAEKVEQLAQAYERAEVMPPEAGAPLPDAPVTTEAATRADPLPLTPEQAFGSPPTAASATGPASAAPTAEPAAPATVPAVPVPVFTTPGAPATDLDAEGLPWDERIHSSNHKRSANGVWMKRRGVAPAIDQTVRAELRQTYPEPAAQPSAAERTLQAAVAEGLIPRPPVQTTSAPAAAIPAPPAVPVPPVPVPSPAAVSVPPAPVASPAPEGSSPEPFDKAFTRIMTMLAGPEGYQKRGVITVEETNGVLAGVGLGKLSDMLVAANHAKIPEFEAALLAFVAARGA